MGVLKGISFPKPGAYGLNTQDVLAASDTQKLFCSQASNLVIDSAGRLCSREDFVLQTSGFSGTTEQLYVHRNNDATETVFSVAGGIIYSGMDKRVFRSNGNVAWSTTSPPTGLTASAAFDGSGDYLNGIRDSLGSGDFTIEAYVYKTGTGAAQVIFDTRSGGSSSAGVAFYITSAEKLALYTGSGNIALSTGTIAQNTWTHVAATRSGSTVKLWIGGSEDGSGSNSADLTDTNIYVGRTNEDVINHFNGKLAALRVTKGTARYSGTFTPPSLPLGTGSGNDASWANVILLALQENGANGSTTFYDYAYPVRFDFRAGSQIVDVGGAKTGASATGLANDATSYTYLIYVDGGSAQTINVTGSAAQTYTDLITQINADVTGATVSLVGGNLKFISATTGATSSIYLTTGGGGTNLFTTLTNFVAVRTATVGTTTNNNWQFATLSSKVFAAQKNQAFTCLNESSFAVESIVGQPWTGSPNVLIAADGRLWAADDEAGNNSYTVWWSNLLNGKQWNTGDAGSLNVQNVWPAGQDSIVALAFMSGRLVILGRHSILLYTLPTTHNPANMELTDVIANLGCSARDSVVIANGDLYFLSDDGAYKLPKLALTTSLLPSPVKISKLVADNVISTYASETLAKVRGAYYQKQRWYVLNAPTANKVYCFHLDRPVVLESDKAGESVPAVTTWTNTGNPFRAFAFDKDWNWFAAMTNGVGKYTGYTPSTGVSGNSAYNVNWDTLWDDFQDEPRLKHLKSFALTLSATSAQTGNFNWKTDYKTATTNAVSFTCSSGEFADGIGTVSGSIGRSCNVAMFGFSAAVNGNKITLEALRIYAQPGSTKIR